MPVAGSAAVIHTTDIEEQVDQETKVGKKLSDLITRRVIVLVLSMLLSVPVFSDTSYLDDNQSFELGLSFFNGYNTGDDSFNACLNSFIM